MFSCFLLASPSGAFIVQDDEKDNTSQILGRYQAAALKAGDAERGATSPVSLNTGAENCTTIQSQMKFTVTN